MSITYRADGTVATETDRNGVTTTYTYDIHGRTLGKTAGGSTIYSVVVKELREGMHYYVGTDEEAYYYSGPPSTNIKSTSSPLPSPTTTPSPAPMPSPVPTVTSSPLPISTPIVRYGGMDISDKLLQFVSDYETYHEMPYRGQDSQNRTVAYGHVITEEDGTKYDNGISEEAALRVSQAPWKFDIAG
ncbi:MAG: hypothetical protein LBH86_09660 [Oscillospiraceae bacterium]|nr:hypothetical protein [Oscillospiraceae bacterium]